MKRILFLLRSFGVGGAERQLCILASGLQRSGYSVKVAVFYAGGSLEAEARNMGIQIVDLKRHGRWDLLPFFFRLVGLIRREKPDILNSYLQVPNIWAALVKLIMPHLKVVWGIRASNIEWKNYGWQWNVTDKVESLLAKIPDWIICNSQAGLLYHAEKGYPSERMSVIQNGIDTDRFFPDRRVGKGLRAEWRVRTDQKLIGTVARLDPIKDLPNFLRTASLLIEERRDIRFVCVGGGSPEYLRTLSELARSLDLEEHLVWAGERSDILNVYNALNIFISSSTSEGFSNVIGEAMACGIPCVVTDVGDSAQLVGSVGEIVPAGDTEALKQATLNLLDQIEKDGMSLNTQVRQRIIDQFSTAKLISRTIETFNAVFDMKRVNRERSLRSEM